MQDSIRLIFATWVAGLLSLTACVSVHTAQNTSTVPVRSPEQYGVYTNAQAAQGKEIYRTHCLACHGSRLNDGTAPPLAGPQFVRVWDREERSLDDLFYIMHTSMSRLGPPLPTQKYVDVLAYILQSNAYPAGEQTLSSDPAILRKIRITSSESSAASKQSAPPAFIRGVNGITPTGKGPAQDELEAAVDNSRDWLYHTHDYTGRRYVPLSQINRANAGRLRVVAAFQVGDPGTFQTGPIVYRGVMYITTAHVTVALDAVSCRPLWRHHWEPQDREVWLNNRGVAIKDGRVVRATPDGYLFALDAVTGALLWARQVANPSIGETFTMAPLIYQDLVLIGPAGSETGISGWVGAFRLENGEPVWRFKTVPGATESGPDAWANPSGIPLGGGAVWTPLSLDTARGELYVAVTNPAPNLPAHLRPGPNLYTNSLVALDVRTGALKWYEQLVPNDAHDWDLTQVSPVFRTQIAGRWRNLVATAGKDGVLRVLDRDTHQRVYETPITSRENAEVPLAKEGVMVRPGVLGGVQWNGPAYNPNTNLLYVPAVDWGWKYALTDTVRYVQGQLYLGGSVTPDTTSQGWLTAVDAATGVIRWRYRSTRPMIAAVTTTAGGIVMTGELTGDFLVLDAQSGEVLYRFNTGGPMGGGIVTYEINGKQYVAVMSGRPSTFWVDENPGSATVLVLSLPD